ncbi:MAG: mechanosensitive ion channel family protein [Nanoarchaeota archaeon]
MQLNWTLINESMENVSQGYIPADYMMGLIAFGAIILFLKIFRVYFLYRLRRFTEKTKTKADTIVVDFVSGVGWPFDVVISLFVVSRFVAFPGVIDTAIYYMLLIMVVYYAGKGAFRVIDTLVVEQIDAKKARDDVSSAQLIRVMGSIGKVVLGIIAVLLIISNLGIDVSSLIAGVGIGGIAVAFALQNILSDLFSSFSIFFDKPFVEGDFIIIGEDMGTIQKIGLKSTRILTLQGHELVVSNNELTSIRINNYRDLKERRALFYLGVVYATPIKKLEKIPSIIKKIIEDTENARFDMANFKKYGDFSLIFEVVYYAETSDYYEYMNINEKIHLEIAKAFKKEKIEFAYPAQKVFLEKGG